MMPDYDVCWPMGGEIDSMNPGLLLHGLSLWWFTAVCVPLLQSWKTSARTCIMCMLRCTTATRSVETVGSRMRVAGARRSLSISTPRFTRLALVRVVFVVSQRKSRRPHLGDCVLTQSGTLACSPTMSTTPRTRQYPTQETTSRRSHSTGS